MSRSRHPEAQVMGVCSKQLEAGRKAEDVAREAGVSKQTISAGRRSTVRMDVNQAQRAKACGTRTQSCGSWWRI